MVNAPRRIPDEDEPIEGVEARLQSHFSPVTPDPEFVNRLRHNLASPPETGLETIHSTQALLIALGISMAGVLMIGLLIRIVWLLLKWTGVLRTSKN